MERRAARKRKTCSLRTSNDRLGELERALVGVEASGADAVAKAGCIVKLVAEARSEIESRVEHQAAEIHQLLESHPEIAKRMQVVK